MHALEKEVLDRLLAGRDSQDAFGEDGLLHYLKEVLSEPILNAEFEERPQRLAHRRKERSRKTVLTGTSWLERSIPRDVPAPSTGSCSQVSPRFPDFDAKIVSVYARGHEHARDVPSEL
ncbi:hypothetical protein [Mesorhizobium sp.]|uniref:hypothetical protein n=1 Tax=Mesorhizobium sp. TaxID=1871066 RepID=UPI000FE7AB16|nr:hypothetical protein [Mesorhizobium sp.]RWK55904.1 MAG: hypothetical protein EOR48_09765 [Mesorhizobium sp.]